MVSLLLIGYDDVNDAGVRLPDFYLCGVLLLSFGAQFCLLSHARSAQ